MADTIKEQVMQKIVSLLQIIAGTPYNTDFEGRVYRARRDLPTLPGMSVYPQPTQTIPENTSYDRETFDLPIRIEALSEYLEAGATEFNYEKADKQSIKVEADIYEALLGKRWRMTFTGATFTGTGSPLDLYGTTMPEAIGGVVVDYSPAFPWATPQDGYIDIIRLDDVDEWTAGLISIGNMTCTGTALIEVDLDISPIDKIEWVSGGIEVYPETIDRPVTTSIDIIARFWHDKGNPYAQTTT